MHKTLQTAQEQNKQTEKKPVRPDKLNKVTESKINIQKLVAFLYINKL